MCPMGVGGLGGLGGGDATGDGHINTLLPTKSPSVVHAHTNTPTHTNTEIKAHTCTQKSVLNCC